MRAQISCAILLQTSDNTITENAEKASKMGLKVMAEQATLFGNHCLLDAILIRKH